MEQVMSFEKIYTLKQNYFEIHLQRPWWIFTKKFDKKYFYKWFNTGTFLKWTNIQEKFLQNSDYFKDISFF